MHSVFDCWQGTAGTFWVTLQNVYAATASLRQVRLRIGLKLTNRLSHEVCLKSADAKALNTKLKHIIAKAQPVTMIKRLFAALSLLQHYFEDKGNSLSNHFGV